MLRASAQLGTLSTQTTTTTGARRCAFLCAGSFRLNSRDSRRFCLTSCRVRAWHQADPAPEEPPGFMGVRLHWHLGGTSFLARDYHAGYWRGPDGCPPECIGIKPPNTHFEPVPEGHEGISPRGRPRSRLGREIGEWAVVGSSAIEKQRLPAMGTMDRSLSSAGLPVRRRCDLSL